MSKQTNRLRNGLEKMGSGSHGEPGTLSSAVTVKNLGAGQEDKIQEMNPASVSPRGWDSLTRCPFVPLMPGGPRDPGGPCGEEEELEKPPLTRGARGQSVDLEAASTLKNLAPWDNPSH